MKRRAVVTILDHIFQRLVHWLSPFLCFTCEEAWLSYKGLTLDDDNESIHLSKMPDTPESWKDAALAEKFDRIIAVRSAVTGALEVKRADKTIGASLEAAPVVITSDADLAAVLESVDFADICITSGITIQIGDVPTTAFTMPGVNVGVVFEKASGHKCERCWKYTEDVGQNAEHPTLCARCADAVGSYPTEKYG